MMHCVAREPQHRTHPEQVPIRRPSMDAYPKQFIQLCMRHASIRRQACMPVQHNIVWINPRNSGCAMLLLLRCIHAAGGEIQTLTPQHTHCQPCCAHAVSVAACAAEAGCAPSSTRSTCAVQHAVFMKSSSTNAAATLVAAAEPQPGIK